MYRQTIAAPAVGPTARRPNRFGSVRHATYTASLFTVGANTQNTERKILTVFIVIGLMLCSALVDCPRCDSPSVPYHPSILSSPARSNLPVTGASAFTVSVPSIQNFASFDMGQFDVTSCETIRFSLAKGEVDVSTLDLPVPYLPCRVIFSFSCT